MARGFVGRSLVYHSFVIIVLYSLSASSATATTHRLPASISTITSFILDILNGGLVPLSLYSNLPFSILLQNFIHFTCLQFRLGDSNWWNTLLKLLLTGIDVHWGLLLCISIWIERINDSDIGWTNVNNCSNKASKWKEFSMYKKELLAWVRGCCPRSIRP